MNLEQFIGEPTIEGSVYFYDDRVEIATEGASWDTAKMIKDADVKKARELVKEANKLARKKKSTTREDCENAVKKYNEAEVLIQGMKQKVDNAPETIGFGEKLLSYFTPIFTLMPSAEITSFMILPDGNGGYYIRYSTKSYEDKMSLSTNSNVKSRLQLKFNVFLKNLAQYRRAAEELGKRIGRTPKKAAKESMNLGAFIGEIATEEDMSDAEKYSMTHSTDVDPSAMASISKDNEQDTDASDVIDDLGTDDDGEPSEEDPEVVECFEAVLTAVLEASLTTAERKALPDDVFGLPAKRQFPLDTPERIKSAKSYFRYCRAEDRKELANNIVKRMKALHMPVEFGTKTVIAKYVDPKYVVDNGEKELPAKIKK